AEIDAGAARYVEDAIAREPIVLFALEWCEFCWSVRKFFARLGVECRRIDLDSVTYQKDDLGGRIRAVLADRLGTRAIPQIFVAGQHIGGCMDLFESWRNGSLRQRFEEHGIRYQPLNVDPATLLPNWVQPRKSA